MNTFSLQTDIVNSPYVQVYNSRIDAEIFDAQFLNRGLIRRYRIRGFDIEIKPENADDSPLISGTVFLEAALYFGETANLTYRIVVSEFEGLCHSTGPLNTDQMIILAGVPLGVEHWHVEDDVGADTNSIDFMLHKCRVKNFFLDHDGRVLTESQSLEGSNEVIQEVFARYRAFLRGQRRIEEREDYDSNYVLVDVWETISHIEQSGFSFSRLSPPEIISHIEERHKSELMGLLTLYPYEWPYRDPRSFVRVCGDNIAIDTDDLVLVSENVTLIIGTYGLRGAGAPTDWRTVLRKRAEEHVCWPEYLHILDIVIAKLHTINAAFYRLQSAAFETNERLNRKELIKKNSHLAMKVSRMIVDMDAVNFSRYASHKLMYKKTEERLNVKDETNMLETALQQFDVALKNIDNMEELQRSRIIRSLLAFITIASVFQVIFEDVRVPLFATLIDDQFATSVGVIVISTVILGLFILGAALIAKHGFSYLLTLVAPHRGSHSRSRD